LQIRFTRRYRDVAGFLHAKRRTSERTKTTICGRGIGNKRFRKLVESHLERYSNTASKLGKTSIISEIVSHVRENSPNGGFVKKDSATGEFFEVDDFLAVSLHSRPELQRSMRLVLYGPLTSSILSSSY
jgi:hypothetical protein